MSSRSADCEPRTDGAPSAAEGGYDGHGTQKRPPPIPTASASVSVGTCACETGNVPPSAMTGRGCATACPATETSSGASVAVTAPPALVVIGSMCSASVEVHAAQSSANAATTGRAQPPKVTIRRRTDAIARLPRDESTEAASLSRDCRHRAVASSRRGAYYIPMIFNTCQSQRPNGEAAKGERTTTSTARPWPERPVSAANRSGKQLARPRRPRPIRATCRTQARMC